METFTNKEAYIQELRSRGATPGGFRFAVTNLEFNPVERETEKPLEMNLSAAVLEQPTESFAGVFTRNKFPGAPVTIARERLTNDTVSGVIINNRIANVCAPGGVEVARQIADRFAHVAGREPGQFFPASTGIIGWSLPVDAMTSQLEPLYARLGQDSAVEMARGIMTTDSFPKLRSADVGNGRILAVAKGAGMIEPNMATLLVFIFTDVTIGRSDLQECLEQSVSKSFNTISVDGDQSTSDMALAFSSNKKDAVDRDQFAAALTAVCSDLAHDVVRNGEGTEHVIRVTVQNAPDDRIALGCAKAVTNSPLVKTAICGNDPNVGRIIGAVGDYAGSTGFELDPNRVRVSIGDEQVFANGAFTLNPEREKSLAEYLTSCKIESSVDGFPSHDRNVEIVVDLGDGNVERVAVGSDLTHGYVSENADYRS